MTNPGKNSEKTSNFTNMTYYLFSLALLLLCPHVHGYGHINVCRSFCGNLTLDYPFALQPGCGHQGFRELLFCINDVLMLHISSGSYRVLDIDYAYQSLVLHDPHMSTCDNLVLGSRGNGFVLEPWRAPYMNPTPDNVFMLLGCSARSSLFQGSPGKNLPCHNVSGLGCEEYYNCPAWDVIGPRRDGPVYGSGPPDCCATTFEAMKGVNLSRLDCQGYSSAYSLAPVRASGAENWAYGIEVKYSLQGNEAFCRSCEATGGTCGYDVGDNSSLCMCGNSNSTTNCDSGFSAAFHTRRLFSEVALTGLLVSAIIWRHYISWML